VEVLLELEEVAEVEVQVQGREGMVERVGKVVFGEEDAACSQAVRQRAVEPILHNTGHYSVDSRLVGVGVVQMEPSLSWVYSSEG
jgi:hypothetical protein